MEEKELIRMAMEARTRAYAPYSNYFVGAALYTKNGNIYSGCNVENASYGATNCAERTAIFKAVSEGEREILAIAIAGGKDGQALDYAFPCGICRQVLREFCNPKQLKIYVAKSETDYQTYTLSELLPDSFGPEMVS